MGSQGAPRTCRCIETDGGKDRSSPGVAVREHHAPVGALRPFAPQCGRPWPRQGAPRTCRCIETVSELVPMARSPGQGAPRTCRCIETSMAAPSPQSQPSCQGAPRTCRCIETRFARAGTRADWRVREHHALAGALRFTGGLLEVGENGNGWGSAARPRSAQEGYSWGGDQRHAHLGPLAGECRRAARATPRPLRPIPVRGGALRRPRGSLEATDRSR